MTKKLPRKIASRNFSQVVDNVVDVSKAEFEKSKKLFEEVSKQRKLKRNAGKEKLWNQLYKFTKHKYKESEEVYKRLSTHVETINKRPCKRPPGVI